MKHFRFQLIEWLTASKRNSSDEPPGARVVFFGLLALILFVVFWSLVAGLK